MSIGYTASSLKAALKTSIQKLGIFCEGLDEKLMCPIPDTFPPLSDIECCGNPATCEKAKLQTCWQPIEISSRPNAASLPPLRFRYTISDTDHDGFIERSDMALRLIINRGYIPEGHLKPCKID